MVDDGAGNLSLDISTYTSNDTIIITVTSKTDSSKTDTKSYTVL